MKTEACDQDTVDAPIRTDAAAYVGLQRSAAFGRLRSRSRRYFTAMTALFLGAFVVTVSVAGWLPGYFAAPAVGPVNVGLIVAVALILLPALVSAVHLSYAGRRLDPLAERVRQEFERNRR